jgi:hypothetical protein
MSTIDEDLNQIERDIRTLKIEYEQFFGGGRKRPPTDTQWRLDNLVRRCNEKSGDLNFGQRFKLNNLTQTYAKYQDFWRKKTMQRETGISQRHFGVAAKAIEAERQSKLAAEQAAGNGNGGRNTATLDDVRGGHEPFVLAFSQPEKEREKLETLYNKLIEARTETGEKAGAPSLQDFEKFVRNKTKDLKSKGGNEVEYTVSIEAGKVKLKARVSN